MTADRNDEQREAVEGFCSELKNLKENNKVAINLLTLMAEDYQEYSAAIVDAIEQTLYKTPPQLKIIILYVVDSILKNLGSSVGNYRKLFEKKIVDMVVHVFKEGNEAMRAQLFRLRSTWKTDHFIKSKLFAIDTKINEIDKAWPIASTSTTRPNTIDENATIKTSTSGNMVHVNPKFFNKNNDHEATNTSDEGSPSPTPTVKQEPLEDAPENGQFSSAVVNTRDPRLRRYFIHHQKRDGSTILGQNLRQKQQQPQKGSPPPHKKFRTTVPHQQQAPHELHMRGKMEPTVAPGLHAFDVSALPPPANETKFLPPAAPRPLITAAIPQPLLSISQPPPIIPNTAIPPPSIPVSMSIIPTVPVTAPPQMQSFPSQTAVVPQLHNQQFPPVQIRDETPRIGLPENKRIFLDGKAYEVFYLEDAAVIERNGLPHRVSFTGAPRDIFIDGIPYRMTFSQTLDVVIDGQRHSLRFGAPGRELYMGSFPFKGAFGGAPIIANINGRQHHIKLSGPAPEVKIDPEPAHELARYMPAQYPRQQRVKPETVKKENAPQDVKELLKKLKQSGLLTAAEQKKQQAQERSSNQPLRKRPPSPPPVACDGRFLNNIQRQAAPMIALDQFSMRALIIRYDSVIDALEKPRIVCQYCGIAFKEIYSHAYVLHADWHVQDTLRTKDNNNKYTRSNPWFMCEDWFTYSETKLVNEPPGATDGDGVDSEAALKGITTASSSNLDVPSRATDERKCYLCKGLFEEEYDDDDDEWKLRGTILKDKRVFHRACHDNADLSNFTEETLYEEANTENENFNNITDFDDFNKIDSQIENAVANT